MKANEGKKRRTDSKCPICHSLDVFGDKWTLLILRDMLIRNKRHYREFLASSEGIATNILADRLKSMLEQGLVTKAEDPDNGAQGIYSPTAKGEALRPVLQAMAEWALRHGPQGLATPPSDRGAS
jgi:DNA-binding HxlR family transcriptional regulator